MGTGRTGGGGVGWVGGCHGQTQGQLGQLRGDGGLDVCRAADRIDGTSGGNDSLLSGRRGQVGQSR